MNSRDRVFAALTHTTADRIPIDFWITDEALDKIKKHLKAASKDAVLDYVDADLRYIAGPVYIGPPLTQKDDGQRDIWGVQRKRIQLETGREGGSYEVVVRSPLEDATSIEELETYTGWPMADWYDFSVIATQCENYRCQERVVVFSGDRTNRIAQLKPYMYLRGMENTYVDLALNKDIFKFVIEKISSFYQEYLARILEAARGKIDIIMTGDDFGSQNNLLCSRESWKELIEPGFRKYLRLIKQSGAYTMHHSCGSVDLIIQDMVDCGLDILQSLQPEANNMNGRALKQKYGEFLCFNGSISIQNTLPFGRAEDIEKEVIDRATELGKNGGFIIGTSHNIQPEVPLGNVLALVNAYRKHLWYK